MTGLAAEIATWPARLERVLDLQCGQHLNNAVVVAQTASTQDVVRQRGAPLGEVVIAAAQLAGRGRFGRAWSGEPADGVCFSLAIHFANAPQLAMACALGVRDGLRTVAGASVQFGVKWPNDVVARLANDGSPWRKICGVLVEQFGDRAIVGIGINVRHVQWPDELRDHAISLRQLGVAVPRIDALEAVLPAVDIALGFDEAQLRRRFAECDVLTGRRVALATNGTALNARILSIDPWRGLHVQCDGEAASRWLAAEATTIGRGGV